MPSSAEQVNPAAERSGYIPSADGAIYCTVYDPAGPGAFSDTLVMLIGAFAEERKSSVRALVETALASLAFETR